MKKGHYTQKPPKKLNRNSKEDSDSENQLDKTIFSIDYKTNNIESDQLHQQKQPNLEISAKEIVNIIKSSTQKKNSKKRHLQCLIHGNNDLQRLNNRQQCD